MIYGIGDLHLDYSKDKSMDIFGEKWTNHEEKIFRNWEALVEDEDLVLLPGDISWALKLGEAHYDLKRIDALPGKKIVSKGNHDYWWEGLKKMGELSLKTISFLQNNSYIHDNVGIFGSRGWMAEDIENFDSHDKKIFNRELNRLKLSLSSIKEEVDVKIAMIHYPPFNMDSTPNKFVDLMKEYNIDICIYGHLHAKGHRSIIEGQIQGIQFYCVASDYINFKPKKII